MLGDLAAQQSNVVARDRPKASTSPAPDRVFIFTHNLDSQSSNDDVYHAFLDVNTYSSPKHADQFHSENFS